MSLHNDIREQMKDAMRAKDALRLGVIRGLLAAFTNEAVAKKRKPDEALSDNEVLEVIARQAKQRKDSIEQFKKGGREDLAVSEEAELAVLETYMPEQMSREEIRAYVEKKKAELNPSPDSKGQFMGAVMKELKGKADGSVVKDEIDRMFS